MLPPKPPEDSSRPLPLFRAEALTAQQQKFYGKIVLIRPFKLTALIWAGIGISSAILGYLLLGTHMERMRIPGVFRTGENNELRAEFYVPVRMIKLIQPGESVPIHCQSCSEMEFRASSGTVRSVPESDSSRADVTARSSSAREPVYRLTLALHPAGGETVVEGTPVEADFPLGRRPLLQWIFERGSSMGAGK
jgi:hypothetical protein